MVGDEGGGGAPSRRTLKPGLVIGGRFEIERVAGAGGMGTVYRARDRRGGDAVALKVLWSPIAEAETWIEREAQILAAIAHPAVAAYVDHGATPGGLRYLAMEWVEGEVLDARIRRGPMRIDEALLIAAGVVDALCGLHERGIVHRDIKPPNIVLEGGDPGQVKILDFGIASHARAASEALIEGPIGTPFYMAPEQARGDPDVDARADLYAVGCVLFECLTGRTPFVAASPLAVLAKTMFEEPTTPSEVRPGLPAGVDALVGRLLRKDRAARPPDAWSVAEALRALRAPGKSAAPTRPAAPVLTGSERRLVSVVLASGALKVDVARAKTVPLGGVDRRGPAPAAAAASGTTIPASTTRREALGSADTVDANATIPALPGLEQPLLRLQQVGRQLGAQIELLRDGSIAAVLGGTGSPMDLASDAARCALALRDLLPEARFALVTGWEVFAGMQPVGQVIDRAAALLDAKPAGGAGRALLDPMTAALLGSRFAISGAGQALSLEGEREAVEEARTLLGRPTTCVGRAEELGQLEALFEGCAAAPAARAVLVTAAAGAGKSRLRDELLSRLRAAHEGLEVWAARGDSMRRKASFGLLAELVRRAAGLHEDEPVELRRQKLAARVARCVSEPLQRRVSEFLGELVGAPFPAEESVQLRAARQEPMLMGDQMRRAWIDFIEAECRAHPLVLVLDDLHWGDQPTADLLDASLRLLADKPLFVLALARPEVSEAFPELWRERSLTSLELGPLSAEACLELAGQALGPAAAAGVIARIFERSAGNAFFLEELVRAEAEGRGGELPDTVLAMMQSRLATLEPEVRRVLRAGSLFGEVFWQGAAAALLGVPPRAPRLVEQLAELERREWITRQPDPRFQEEEELAFRHALVREAAYEMLTEDDRALGHRLAGMWLEGAGERDAMALATHFDRGGDLERASEHYRAAALLALEGNDLAGAVARVDLGIGCGASGARLGELAQIRAEAHRWQGNFGEGVAWALRAQDALPKGSAGWFAATREALASMVDPSERDRIVAIADALDELWAGPEAASGPQIVAMVWSAIRLHDMALHERSAGVHARLSEALPRFEAEPSACAQVFSYFAYHEAHLTSDMSAISDLLRRSLDEFERAGDLRSACIARANVGHTLNELGLYAEATAMLHTLAADTRQLGLANAEALALGNLGRAQAGLGLLDEARASEEEAIAAFVAQKDARMEAVSRAYLAVIHRRRGHAAEAEAEARRAAAMLEERPTLLPMGLAVLAEALLAQGRSGEALAAAERAVASADLAEEGQARVRLAHAEALHAEGRTAEARESIERAQKELLKQASAIADPARRQSFLTTIEENARTLSLARAWLPASAGSALA